MYHTAKILPHSIVAYFFPPFGSSFLPFSPFSLSLSRVFSLSSFYLGLPKGKARKGLQAARVECLNIFRRIVRELRRNSVRSSERSRGNILRGGFSSLSFSRRFLRSNGCSNDLTPRIFNDSSFGRDRERQHCRFGIFLESSRKTKESTLDGSNDINKYFTISPWARAPIPTDKPFASAINISYSMLLNAPVWQPVFIGKLFYHRRSYTVIWYTRPRYLFQYPRDSPRQAETKETQLRSGSCEIYPTKIRSSFNHMLIITLIDNTRYCFMFDEDAMFQ